MWVTAFEEVARQSGALAARLLTGAVEFHAPTEALDLDIVSRASDGAVVTELSPTESRELFEVRDPNEGAVLWRAFPRLTEDDFTHAEEMPDIIHHAFETEDISVWGA